MGAWGHEPWDNDIAADYCNKLADIPVVKWITNGLLSLVPEEQIVAAWMLGQIGINHFVYPGELRVHISNAIKRLDDLLVDDWIDTWKTPEKIRFVLIHLRLKLAMMAGIEVPSEVKPTYRGLRSQLELASEDELMAEVPEMIGSDTVTQNLTQNLKFKCLNCGSHYLEIRHNVTLGCEIATIKPNGYVEYLRQVDHDGVNIHYRCRRCGLALVVGGIMRQYGHTSGPERFVSDSVELVEWIEQNQGKTKGKV